MLVAALAVVFMDPSAAQTVYKLIDRNGKVTYAEKPPKYFDGQVIRIDINPEANRATLTAPAPPRELAPHPAPPTAADHRGEQLDAARKKLEEATKALADARDNPGEDDMRFMGNVGGGVRRVPTEAYQQRLAILERQVKEAKDEVDALEKAQ